MLKTYYNELEITTSLIIIFYLVIDLRNWWIILDGWMGVHSFAVEVAEAVVGLDDAAQLAVTGVVEAGVGGEDQ